MTSRLSVTSRVNVAAVFTCLVTGGRDGKPLTLLAALPRACTPYLLVQVTPRHVLPTRAALQAESRAGEGRILPGSRMKVSSNFLTYFTVFTACRHPDAAVLPVVVRIPPII